MTKVYSRRIFKIGDVSVYAGYVDSSARSFTVIQARRTIAQFSSRDAAIAAATRLAAGEVGERHTDELIAERARSLSKSAALDGGLDVRLLAALEIQRLENETTSKARVDLARLVGNLAAQSGEIPSTAAALEGWIERALDAVLRPSNRGVNSRSALTARLQTFTRIVRRIQSAPVTFARWLHVPSLVAERADTRRKGERKDFDAEESFEPLDKSTVAKLISETASLAEALSLVIYLSGGFRAGEPERLTARHITPDGLVDLPALVTKTKGKRQPRASVVLRAAVAWFAADPAQVIALPADVERKRLRPTAAVHLLLARQTQLEVMERLGHSTLAMITNHYAKLVPMEFAKAKSATHYFGVKELSFEGTPVPGNQWDWFLLVAALGAATRLGDTSFRDFVRTIVVGVGEDDDEVQAVVDL